MKLQGWDGNEDLSKVQWTRTGALFYSIIVITTIGKIDLFFIHVFLMKTVSRVVSMSKNNYNLVNL